MEGFMLVLLLKCCGPDAIVSDVQDRLTEVQCYARGHTFMKDVEGQGFMCLKRQYPKARK